MKFGPIPVAALSEAWVCGCSLVGIAGLNSVVGMDVCLLGVLCVVQVEVTTTGRSLIQRSPIEWCVCVCVCVCVCSCYLV